MSNRKCSSTRVFAARASLSWRGRRLEKTLNSLIEHLAPKRVGFLDTRYYLECFQLSHECFIVVQDLSHMRLEIGRNGLHCFTRFAPRDRRITADTSRLGQRVKRGNAGKAQPHEQSRRSPSLAIHNDVTAFFKTERKARRQPFLRWPPPPAFFVATTEPEILHVRCHDSFTARHHAKQRSKGGDADSWDDAGKF
eukprot:scaffold2510_cov169-Amphora_coffeaeformis.AAC.41